LIKTADLPVMAQLAAALAQERFTSEDIKDGTATLWETE